jgi:hypothetical protein
MDWLVDLCVYAPIGFALDASRYLPEFASKGRDQVAAARFLGRFAVQHLESSLGPLGPLLKAVIGTPATPAPTTGSTPAPPTDGAATAEPSTSSEPSDGTNGSEAVDPVDPIEMVGFADPVDPLGSMETVGSVADRDTPTATTKGRTTRKPRAAPRPVSPGVASSATARSRKVPAGTSSPAPGPVAPSAPHKPVPSGSTRAAARAKPAPGSARQAAPASSAAEPLPSDAAVTASLSGSTPVEAELAIEGYSTLAASQVVPRLATLNAAELDAIGRYERGHRARRTILNRVAQLLAEG